MTARFGLSDITFRAAWKLQQDPCRLNLIAVFPTSPFRVEFRSSRRFRRE